MELLAAYEMLHGKIDSKVMCNMIGMCKNVRGATILDLKVNNGVIQFETPAGDGAVTTSTAAP